MCVAPDTSVLWHALMATGRALVTTLRWPMLCVQLARTKRSAAQRDRFDPPLVKRIRHGRECIASGATGT
ncbi:hypothetical protein PF005_g17529 [Phytophthora fragariae]|uniref:PIN domain-containing protein n=1 Tax=Phytophthora fragariae TaxID=53985 RepID=A0A6A3SY60_9STRA|nr:hypothetical protein PF003_g20281 [Phytophthora fragariae]KAE8931231.1 hypothetical protein PF009_g18710 [Phytophthora fragariae]KAE8997653.1 hypothetical protein PF011_g15393 [Phytophthora fragariae]KAE9097443.1 hypothetical protein PF007_g16618 [Phytophthora fragariae]KAE9125818.1 hypothetical protein PF006_g16873 [Phytophthora fragariae]